MIENILVGVLSSFAASIVFWFLTFRVSRTNIRFSDCIEKSHDVYDSTRFRYRIKLINTGKRDLLEVTYTVRLSINRTKISNNTYLSLGYPYMRPILYGKKWQMKNRNKIGSYIIPLLMTESTFEEFRKQFYYPKIREAAENKTLGLDDIFQAYKDKVVIIIYACGYDSITGARKMFISKKYTYKDIRDGKFNGSCDFPKYNEYVEHILKIHPSPKKAKYKKKK